MTRSLPRTAKTLLTMLALSVILSTWAGAAHAAGDGDGDVTWMVRPSDGTGEDGRSWIELELDPGDTVQEHLLVRNLSSSTVTFGLSAADGYFTDTGRFNMLTSDEPSVDAGTWIDIPQSVEVASGSDAIVAFTVTVPENATPGDHPAGVAAGIRSGGDEQVGVESRVGFRVMTRVSGELAPSVAPQVSGGYTGSWNPFEPGRIDIDYAVENTGNTRLAALPEVSVSALFGLVSYEIAAEAIVEMAPGDSRTASVSAPVWPWGVYAATVTTPVTVVGEDGRGGDAPASQSATTVIAAVPVAQLIALALVIGVGVLLWRGRRRRDRAIEERIERARREGHDAALVTESPSARGGAVVGVVTGLIIAVTLGVDATPAAADATEDLPSPGIAVRVEVDDPLPAPPSPAPSSSDAAGESALPATGGSDLRPVVVAGVAAVGIGVVALGRRQARRSTHPGR